MNKREAAKKRIRDAVMSALEDIVGSGEKVTQAAVIRKAVFENGAKLGKTTLYSKNPNTGLFVHEDLLKEIALAADRQCRGHGRKSKSETTLELKGKLKELRAENDSLVDQIVSQQEKVRVLTMTDAGEGNQLKRLEDRLYVLSRLLDQATGGAIPEMKKDAAMYMDLHAGSERLALANEGVKRYSLVMKDSTISMGSVRAIRPNDGKF